MTTSWYDDEEGYAPYKSIGVVTTLPGGRAKPQRPIGFIWPKQVTPTRQKKPRA